VMLVGDDTVDGHKGKLGLCRFSAAVHGLA
jgi:hypothetical protein